MRRQRPTVKLNGEDDIGEFGLSVSSEEGIVLLSHEVFEIETGVRGNRAVEG